MTQIFTNDGLGVQTAMPSRESGTSDIAGLGQRNNNIHVNVANGNLVVRQEDGFLANPGFGLNIFQTYNSQGSQSWVFNLQSRLFFEGTLHSENSCIKRLDEDGHLSIFIFDSTRGCYIAQDGHLASLRDGNGCWEYTEGEGAISSLYDAQGQLQYIQDSDGHRVSFEYEADKLTRVSDTSAKQQVIWQFEHGLLISVFMESEGQRIHQVHYEYDTQGRIASLRSGVGTLYQVNYQYEGDSTRIRYLQQSDGVHYYFEYEGNKLIALHDGLGGITRYRYETGKTRVTLPSGHIWIYHYDEKARLTEIEGPGQYSLQYRYHNNQLSTIIQGARQWHFYYNAAGDCERTIEPSGRIISRLFDDHHRILKEEYILPVEDNPAQTCNQHRYLYDMSGHLRFTIEEDGAIQENRYDSQGFLREKRLWSMRQIPGNITLRDLENLVSSDKAITVSLEKYEYDWRGQCTKTTQYQEINAVGEGIAHTALLTFTEYDAAGRLIAKSTPAQSGMATTLYFYDALGRLEKVVEPTGKIKRLEYDDHHQRIIETDAAGLETITHLDARGFVISVHKLKSQEDFGTTFYTLDAQGNRICETDPTGRKQWHFYNPAGKLQATVAADGQLTWFQYDEYNNLIETRIYNTLIDVTSWDSIPPALETVIPANHPADRIMHQIYDKNGFLKATIDAEGAAIVYRRNAAGQILEMRALAEKISVLTNDNRMFVQNPQDRCMHYYYNAANQLQAIVDGEGYATEYIYNAAGKIIETIRYAKAIVQYTGNWQIDLPASVKADMHIYTLYNAAGLKIGEINAEGYLTEYRYDASGWLLEMRNWYNRVTIREKPPVLTLLRPSPDERDQCTFYRYNTAGLCLEIRQHNGLVTTFTYDGMDRVIAINHQDANTGDNRLECKRYDTAGRLIAELDAHGAALLQNNNLNTETIDQIWKNHGTHFYYDESDRLTATINAKGETTRYFYNAAGLPIYRIDADGGVTETQYNAFHEIASIRQYSTSLNRAEKHTLESLQQRLPALKNDKTDKMTHYTRNHTGLVETISTAVRLDTINRYNAFGEIETSQDMLSPNQSTETRYQYDRRGLLIETLKGSEHLTVHTTNQYDAFGRLQIQSDGKNQKTRYTYDKCGRMLYITRDDNTWRSLSWDAFGRIVRESDWSGSRAVHWQYQNNTFSKIASDGECLSITQTNAFGDTISITDSAGNKTDYFYNEKGENTTIEHPDGTRKNYQYDALGRLIWQEDAEGQTIFWTYDAMGRKLTETRDPSGLNLKKSYTFDALGRQLTMQDASGQIQQFVYNDQGFLESVLIDPEGLQLRTTFTYDAAGHVLRKTVHNPGGKDKVTAYTWDALGRCTSTTEDPDNLALTTQHTYDANDNIIKTINPAGVETHYIYNSNNQCIFQIDPNGLVTESRYDANGNNTCTIKYAHRPTQALLLTEKDMRLQLREHPADQWQFRVFDMHNRINLTFDAEGYATSYAYDQAGNLHKTIRFAQPVSLKRLKSGQFSVPSEKDSRQTLYFHDDLNRLRFTVDSLGYVKEQKWNKAGFCTEMIVYAHRLDHFPMIPDKQSLELLLQPDSAHDQIIRKIYDKAGRLCFQRSAEGMVTSWKYDGTDRIIQTTVHATCMQEISCDFSAIPESIDDRTTHTLYDAAGRLIFTINPDGVIQEYAYDKTGNTLRDIVYSARYNHSEINLSVLQHWGNASPNQTNRSTHYQYDATGKITTATDASGHNTIYQYDQAGNITQKQETNDAVWSYVYDEMNRLIETHSPAVDVYRKNAQGIYTKNHTEIITRLQYDLFGNLISRTEDALGDAITTRFSYDRVNNLCDTIYPDTGVYIASNTASADRNESLQILHEKKVWNAFGEVIATQDKAGYWRYLIRDSVGQLRFSVNATGALTQHTYDAFGNCVMTIAHALPQLLLPDNKSCQDVARMVTWHDQDRQTWMSYDRENRLVSTKRNGERSYNAATKIYEQGLHPETRQTYDVFGQVKTKSSRLHTEEWAVTQFYYNKAGAVCAQVDALGYITTREWNAFGECAEEIQYATALKKGQEMTTPLRTSQDRHFIYHYDALGRLTVKTQKQVQYHRMENNACIPVTEDLHTIYSRDAQGNLVSMQDAAGYTTHMYYDTLGQLKAKIGPALAEQAHSAITYSYNSQGKLVETHQWEKGASSPDEFSFRLNGDSDKDIITRSDYDALGQLISSEDGMRHRTYYSYDANGRLAREWDILHQWGETILRDKHHQYDAEGHVLEIKTFKNTTDYLTEDFTYNIFGELQSKGFNKQFQIHLDYDQSGRIWRSNARGFYEIYLYNLDDKVTQTITSSNAGKTIDLATFPLENVLRFNESGWSDTLQKQDKHYDALGHVIFQRTRHEDGANTLYEASQSWIYNRFGNMVSHTNTQGHETHYVWNALDVLSKKILPEVDMENAQGQTLRIRPEQVFFSDALGRTISQQDANGNSIYKRYDALGQLREETDALGSTTHKNYDLLGQLTQTIAANGAIIQYTYDQANRLIAVHSADQSQQYLLDEAGHILRSQHNSEAMHNWYDNRGNLIKKLDPRLHQTIYRYDDQGNKIEEWDALNNTQKWVYENNLLKSHTDLGGHTTVYKRNQNGLVEQETSTRGRKIQYRYTHDGKLRQFEDEAHRETINFTYDSEGRIKTREGGRVANGRDGWLRETENYTYDALGRLMSLQRVQPDEVNPDQVTASYTYDAAGNIRHTKVINQKKNHQTALSDAYYLYDANNRMLINKGNLINGRIAIGANQGTALVYDKSGNIQEARQYESGSEQTWKYSYNQRNQVALIEKNGKRVQAKSYDASGRVDRETIFDAKNEVDKIHVMHWERGLLAGITTLNKKQEELSRETLEYDVMDNKIKSTLRTHVRPDQTASTLTHVYSHHAKFSSYQQTSDELRLSIDNGTTTTGLSTRKYDINGQLQDVIDNATRYDGGNNIHYWYSSLDGLRSREEKTGKTVYLNLDGKTIADTHYAQDGSASMHVYAGFSPASRDSDHPPSQTPLPEMPQGAQSEYILQANDSLEQIALQVYGDSSLWYVIADANGLINHTNGGKNENLRPGQHLIIPPVAMGQHHTHETHRVLDSNQLTGYTGPAISMPLVLSDASKKTKLLAKIVVVVVSMVATVLTAGLLGGLAGAAINTLGQLIATGFNLLSGSLTGGSLLGMSMGFAAGFAGNLAGQRMANALGAQRGLDLKSSLINGLATAIGTKALPGTKSLQNFSSDYFNSVSAAQMMQSDAIHQGLSMAFHRQSRFNWAELISTGATGGIMGGKKIQNVNQRLKDQHGLAGKLATQQVQSIIQEGAQSLLSGKNFNAGNILENNIGSSIGNTLLESLSQTTPTVNNQNPDESYLTDIVLDILHPERQSAEIYQRSLKQQNTARKKEAYSKQSTIVTTTKADPINTNLIGKASMINGIIKIGYEGYIKYKVGQVLYKANKLHYSKIMDMALSPDLKKAIEKFSPKSKSKSVAMLTKAQNISYYKMMGKFATALNVSYVIGEGYNAYVNNEAAARPKEVTAAVGGAVVEVGAGIVATHVGGMFIGTIAGSANPLLAPIGYATGNIMTNLAYNLFSFGSDIKDATSNFIKGSWNMYKDYERVPSQIFCAGFICTKFNNFPGE